MRTFAASKAINAVKNMATTTARQHTSHPMSYYWGVVKDMDDSQKLELVTMLIESVRPAVAKAEATEDEEYSLRPYTREEINAMLDEAEAEIAAGIGISHEDMMREWEEEFAREEQEELEASRRHQQEFEMAEAV